ncbi:MAG: hypothetical protein WA139_00125 [Candidatus Aenigmatarchaeota archaeon]
MKAISAVIATVMLLIITVSLVGVFYVFSSALADTTASSGSEQVSQLTAQLSTCVRIDNMVGNRIAVTNCGTGIITNGSLAVFVDDARMGISMNTIPENGQGVANITDMASAVQGSHSLQIRNGVGSDTKTYSSIPRKGTESNPGLSCDDIFSSGFLPSDGMYWINAGSSSYKAFCDMSRTNILPSNSWTIGNGSVGIFYQNGMTSENSREFGAGPDGSTVIVWKGGNDNASDADGGWGTGSFPIDNTKTYRVSVWIKKNNSNDGSTYLGIQGGQVFAIGDANKTINNNPYFFTADLPSLDKWYLLVGYIHGSNTTATTSMGGIYDKTTGSKVVSFGNYYEFRFTPSATTQVHRTFLYYDTTIADRQYFWNPRFEEMSGREPSINQLLLRA